MTALDRLPAAFSPRGCRMVGDGASRAYPEMCKAIRMCDGIHGRESYRENVRRRPQPEAAQPAGEAEEVGVFGERFIDGMGWAVPCSRAAPYVAAMRKAAFAMAEKEAGAYVGAGAHGIPDEPAPSAPADVEADIQKLESYLDDADTRKMATRS